ncbi:unnamed protein product [Rotaria magnacalcarata]|uniref:Uncharacterized protein n=2 Tax=Rotaria magnacalcarata TaxID=392030 RepID=A0A815RZA7_9BILA|nr:unnamed protein product [Rotaria magnacalcarata]CAF4042476.1 unnamed protein product [Rotaria magnacalcarata]CAF5218635.1 unnamed protein product [Rotaria magnacalcarata]
MSSLTIDIIKDEKQTSTLHVNTRIFTMLINLQYLNFGSSSFAYQRLSFEFSPSTVCSSSLLELYVCLRSFSDCLYLLNGHFNQLRTFYVNITRIHSSRLTIDNKEQLPNLRCFSLNCDKPLLNRMLNLEKIDLNLVVGRNRRFIDGNELKKNIINHMPQLNKFVFNIRSTIHLPNEIEL